MANYDAEYPTATNNQKFSIACINGNYKEFCAFLDGMGFWDIIQGLSHCVRYENRRIFDHLINYINDCENNIVSPDDTIYDMPKLKINDMYFIFRRPEYLPVGICKSLQQTFKNTYYLKKQLMLLDKHYPKIVKRIIYNSSVFELNYENNNISNLQYLVKNYKLDNTEMVLYGIKSYDVVKRTKDTGYLTLLYGINIAIHRMQTISTHQIFI